MGKMTSADDIGINTLSDKIINQLIDNFDQIFHQEFKDNINSFCVCNMFNNYRGAMLGNGEIWINNTPNSTENKFDFTITAINN